MRPSLILPSPLFVLSARSFPLFVIGGVGVHLTQAWLTDPFLPFRNANQLSWLSGVPGGVRTLSVASNRWVAAVCLFAVYVLRALSADRLSAGLRYTTPSSSSRLGPGVYALRPGVYALMVAARHLFPTVTNNIFLHRLTGLTSYSHLLNLENLDISRNEVDSLRRACLFK